MILGYLRQLLNPVRWGWQTPGPRRKPGIKSNEGPGRRDRELISRLANMIDELSSQMLVGKN